MEPEEHAMNRLIGALCACLGVVAIAGCQTWEGRRAPTIEELKSISAGAKVMVFPVNVEMPGVIATNDVAVEKRFVAEKAHAALMAVFEKAGCTIIPQNKVDEFSRAGGKAAMDECNVVLMPTLYSTLGARIGVHSTVCVRVKKGKRASEDIELRIYDLQLAKRVRTFRWRVKASAESPEPKVPPELKMETLGK